MDSSRMDRSKLQVPVNLRFFRSESNIRTRYSTFPHEIFLGKLDIEFEMDVDIESLSTAHLASLLIFTNDGID